MNIGKMITIFIGIAFSYGCMGPGVIEEENKGDFGSIGVVNILENSIEGKKLGKYLVDSEHFVGKNDVSDLHEEFQDILLSTLKKRNYDVFSVPAQGDKLLTINDVYHDLTFAGLYGRDRTTPFVKENLLNIANLHNLDTVVLITPGYDGKLCAAGKYCGGKGNSGFGVYYDSALNDFYAYYSAYIFVIKVPEYEVILDGWTHGRESLGPLSWKSDLGLFTVTERKKLTGTIGKAVKLKLPDYLKEVGF